MAYTYLTKAHGLYYSLHGVLVLNKNRNFLFCFVLQGGRPGQGKGSFSARDSSHVVRYGASRKLSGACLLQGRVRREDSIPWPMSPVPAVQSSKTVITRCILESVWSECTAG